jgi:hypothetical protein
MNIPLAGVSVAVDFDGTCVTHEYPAVGRDVGAEPILLELVAKGANLILWTMRSGKELADAVRWFEERKIRLWGINENPQQKTWTQSPKAYAKIYIDDAALGAPLRNGKPGERPFIDWKKVRIKLLPKPKRKK